jgi:hypothetical protein
MRKAAALLFIFFAIALANASDWRCNEAGAATEATANEFQHADGVNVFLVSDALLFIMASCPTQFFDYMATRPDVFKGWVSELEEKSGFAPNEKTGQKVEVFLSHLQRQLKDLRLPNKTQEQMRLRVLQEISTMCVSVVDHNRPSHPCHRN